MALAITGAGGGAKSAKFHAKYSEKSSIFGHFSPQIAASRAFAGLGVVPGSFLDVPRSVSGTPPKHSKRFLEAIDVS